MAKTVLFASSEVYPFAKTGGLADVAYALPRALKSLYDIRVVLPLYQSISRERYEIVATGESFEVPMGDESYLVELYCAQYEGMEYCFIYNPLLCDHEYLYGPPGEGYENNSLRFSLFSYALYALIREKRYDVVHLNDWQCALTALLIHQDETLSPNVLYTIHNLAYQGIFDHANLEKIGLDERYFTMGSLEFYGKINLMKAGIAYADTVTTVSPTYAHEIMTKEFGCGLEGFLHFHRQKVIGILNGIDEEHFSPKNDPMIIAQFSDLKGKKANKSEVLKQLKLKGVTKPLFVFIGRFADQKGMDILIEALPWVAESDCNFALLGEGESRYTEALQKLSKEHKNVALHSGYDEALSHQMYAAADFLVMPSLFEPCGLNQMIAFVYGAIPIVHRVGGLADTVKRCEKYQQDSCAGYGIVFNSPTARSLLSALRKGCELYGDKKHFERIVNHNMKADFSWQESAKAYATLYEKTHS